MKPRAPVHPLKKGLSIAGITLVVLAVIGFLGYRGYGEFQQRRLVKNARVFLDQKDYRNAHLSAQRALELDQRSVEATQLMAEITEAGGSRQALAWWRAAAELQPSRPDIHLRWAEAAVNFQDFALAEQALLGVDEEGKKTAAYDNASGRVALALKRRADAEMHFLRAVEREPGNERYQLDLAVSRLASDSPETREQARNALEKWLENPAMRRPALRALLWDAMTSKDPNKALALAKELGSAPGASLEDRLQHLKLLRQLKQPEFSSSLAGIQADVMNKADQAAFLIIWLKNNGMAMIALDWSKSLPENVRGQLPVPQAITEAYAELKDWAAVQGLVENTNWQHLEYMRLAFLARVKREAGDELGWINSWNAAVTAAVRPEALIQLATVAAEWRWEEQSVDLLWKVAHSASGQQWAVQSLYRHFEAKRSTRNLLRVANRMLEIDPSNASAQSNFAALSLLLGTDMKRAMELASAAYQRDPKNPSSATTYAFALHLHGQTEKGLEIMRALDARHLKTPRFAAYYSSLLVSSGALEEGKKFLEVAEQGELLPEERAMVTMTREAVVRESSGQKAAVQ